MSAEFPQSSAVLPLPIVRRRQLRRIVPKFLESCRSQRIFEVQIIHGTHDRRARHALHAVLKELPQVACFRTSGDQTGSARATIVVLLGLDEV
jgi:DNA-nicking Smr family endonuclease